MSDTPSYPNFPSPPPKMRWGRFQIALPRNSKDAILLLARQSGMRKAEFLRVCLLAGVSQMADVLHLPFEGFPDPYDPVSGSDESSA